MQERRKHVRHRILKGAKIAFPGHRAAIDCTARNISDGGACLAGDPKSPHTTSTQVLSITGPSAHLHKLEALLFGESRD